MQYREPYLAFAMSNGKKFVQIDKTNANLVELAPLYLIWKKAKKMGYTEKRQFRKIYQIIGINLITDPQKGITRGQRLYNRYCIRCHAVKGSGGSIGPVLERSDIIKRWGRKKVVQYIIHPKQFNSQSKMPAFNYVEKKQRYPIVEQIVKYIETISPSNRQKKRSSKAESLNKIFN
jgi:mono/diheme cytochrome c family protein